MGQSTLKPDAPLPTSCEHDYLLLSDVHLGADLVAHLRPWATSSWLTQPPEVDALLVPFLEDRQRERRPGRKLCLVIVGDFLDLVGTSLPPVGVCTTPTREERLHGLGSAADHVVRKVEAIADRHARLFQALCAFLCAGNQLVLVQGNHDVELHWRAARRALTESITRYAPEQAQQLRQRITICPWFFKVDGLLYAEHGHEFDAMCSYGDPLLPTCLWDCRRIRAAPFSVMLRQVARPTRGLSTAVYENAGFPTYVKLLLKLGLSGSARIAVRFARAVRSLLWEHALHRLGPRPRRVARARASRRRFCRRSRVPETLLRELQKHHAKPAAQSLRAVLHSLYVDRILAIAFSLAGALVAITLAASAVTATHSMLCALPAALLGCYGALGIRRDISPGARMARGAEAIARSCGVRWVCMGHTHEAGETALANGARYVNLGHWGQDDVPEERAQPEVPAACTFFSLEAHAGSYEGKLLRWQPGQPVAPYEKPTPVTECEKLPAHRPAAFGPVSSPAS